MSGLDGKKVFDFRLLSRIFAYAKPYAGKFRISVALALTLAALTPLRPVIINKTLATVNAGGSSSYSEILDFLIVMTILQLVLLVTEAVLRFYFTYLTSWLGHSVVKDMRVTVFEKILNLNLRQFDQTPIGTLTTRTINDIEAINDIFSEGLVPILADFLSILAILGAMFYIDWQLTLVCLIPFPIMIIATYFFKESVNRSFTQVRNAVASLNAFVQEHISGMQIIQSFTAEKGNSIVLNPSIRSTGMLTLRPYLRIRFFFLLWKLCLHLQWGFWFGMHQGMPMKVRPIQQFLLQAISYLSCFC